jgi:hypothetical protein
MLKVFASNLRFSSRKPVIFLWPFLDCDDPVEDVDYGRFDEWRQEAHTFYSLTNDIEESDLCAYAYELKAGEDDVQTDLKRFEETCRRAGKPLVAFNNEDSTDLFSFDFATLFSTSYYKSQKRDNTRLYLGWSKDFQCYRDVRRAIETTDIAREPDVAYCGYGYVGLSSLKKVALGLVPGKLGATTAGSTIRGYAMARLAGSRRIKKNFILRNGFLGGVREAREGYVENMFSANYGLCARGAGNFSYRFVELLSAGVIPLFVDTDSDLPFSDELDWRGMMPIVEVGRLHEIVDVLVDFHRKNAHQLQDIRLRMRAIYEDYLKPLSWFGKRLPVMAGVCQAA